VTKRVFSLLEGIGIWIDGRSIGWSWAM